MKSKDNALAARVTAKLATTALRDPNQHRIVRLDFVARAYEATCANGSMGVPWRIQDVAAFVGADITPTFARRYTA